ncbi:hypothetical protein V5799_032657 [Amblyomma americanum]|uniref:Uncharacterized protein n=1 Tax=Amblyomma americanum TaxID=6943 RepID=A0AAQ4DQJ3_AMBAM
MNVTTGLVVDPNMTRTSMSRRRSSAQMRKTQPISREHQLLPAGCPLHLGNTCFNQLKEAWSYDPREIRALTSG